MSRSRSEIVRRVGPALLALFCVGTAEAMPPAQIGVRFEFAGANGRPAQKILARIDHAGQMQAAITGDVAATLQENFRWWHFVPDDDHDDQLELWLDDDDESIWLFAELKRSGRSEWRRSDRLVTPRLREKYDNRRAGWPLEEAWRTNIARCLLRSFVDADESGSPPHPLGSGIQREVPVCRAGVSWFEDNGEAKSCLPLPWSIFEPLSLSSFEIRASALGPTITLIAEGGCEPGQLSADAGLSVVVKHVALLERGEPTDMRDAGPEVLREKVEGEDLGVVEVKLRDGETLDGPDPCLVQIAGGEQ